MRSPSPDPYIGDLGLSATEILFGRPWICLNAAWKLSLLQGRFLHGRVGSASVPPTRSAQRASPPASRHHKAACWLAATTFCVDEDWPQRLEYAKRVLDQEIPGRKAPLLHRRGTGLPGARLSRDWPMPPRIARVGWGLALRGRAVEMPGVGDALEFVLSRVLVLQA